MMQRRVPPADRPIPHTRLEAMGWTPGEILMLVRLLVKPPPAARAPRKPLVYAVGVAIALSDQGLLPPRLMVATANS